MANAFHGDQGPTEGIHVPFNYSYADAPARTGATGFTADDIGKLAYQEDNATLWMLTAITPTWAELTGSGAVTTFLGLTDTPASYTGQANKKVSVNVGETALEFTDNTFLLLSDTPAVYTGQANKIVAVNVGETALEFITSPGSYPFDILTVDLTDPDADYSSLSAAAAAAISGDVIKLGPGTHTSNGVSIPAGVHIVGSGPDITTLTTTSTFQVLQLNGSHVLSNLTITIDESDEGTLLENIRHIGASGTITLWNCHLFVRNTNGSGVKQATCFLTTNSITVRIYGGKYESSGADGAWIFSGPITAELLNLPQAIAATAIADGGTGASFSGPYLDSSETLIGGGSGITGPGSSTDNALVRWDGTSGGIVQNSGVTLDDSNNLTLPDTLLIRPVLKDYALEVNTNATSGAAATINLENGNVHDVTLTANCTFTFSNPPATGKAGAFTLILRQDGIGGRTVTWPASVRWAGGTAPTLSSGASEIDILSFFTVDAGTIWFGFSVGLDMS